MKRPAALEGLERLQRAVEQALSEGYEPFESLDVLQAAAALDRDNIRAWRGNRRNGRVLSAVTVVVELLFAFIHAWLSLMLVMPLYAFLLFRMGRTDYKSDLYLHSAETRLANVEETLRIRGIEGR